MHFNTITQVFFIYSLSLLTLDLLIVIKNSIKYSLYHYTVISFSQIEHFQQYKSYPSLYSVRSLTLLAF